MTTRMVDHLSNHENIALQFSGGKDSLAVAYLLRPYWDRITLYHVDAGDLLPEIREVVETIEKIVPRFVRIETDSNAWMDKHGSPSDLVPTSCTPSGVMIGMSEKRLVDRHDCCACNVMMPMHDRAIADGCTLVIRGTKRADFKRMPAENGPTGLGYDLWLPLLEWSHDDVFSYLKSLDLPLCRVYEHRVNAPECATCPAWWSEGRAEYLGKYHPALAAEYHRKLAVVSAEVLPFLDHLKAEMVDGR